MNRRHYTRIAEAAQTAWETTMLAVLDNLLDHIEKCAALGKTSTFLACNPKAAGDNGQLFSVDECNQVCAKLLQAEGFDAIVRGQGIVIRWGARLEAN